MTVVSRISAQWLCAMGLFQLLFATGLAMCGFIVLGLFVNLSCLGIWIGFPMMIPAICSVIVLGTRKRCWSILVVIFSFIILVVSAYHIYVVYEKTAFWEKYRKYAEDERRVCYNRGDQCSCSDDADYLKAGYRVQFCDQFRIGEELFWTMIGLTVGGALFSLLSIFVGIWATCSKADDKRIA